jgi:hypothetical protein
VNEAGDREPFRDVVCLEDSDAPVLDAVPLAVVERHKGYLVPAIDEPARNHGLLPFRAADISRRAYASDEIVRLQADETHAQLIVPLGYH